MFTPKAFALLLISFLYVGNLNIGSALNDPILENSNAQNPNFNDLTRYVDPFIGTGAHGHTFPGASVPFGMVQLSPDTRLSGWDSCSGYHYSDTQIYGFSHTHLSGTGISDYGDILVMPRVGLHSFKAQQPALPAGSPGSTQDPLRYTANFKHENEAASPGYYRVKLDDGLQVELTASARVGFHRYTFPAHTDIGNVIVDLVHRDRVLDSHLRVVDTQHIEGFRRSSSWAKDQIVYFVAEFSRPFQSFITTTDNQLEQHSTNIKAAFRFDQPGVVMMKVGISSVSIEGARKNLKTEVDHWDFNRVRADASALWNKELNKIQVSGGNQEKLKTFYTALYHLDLVPNIFMDVDGQYLGRDFKVHKAEGFQNYTVFSIWDTFRAAHPLYTILDQKCTVDFINTFLTQYRQGGRLPVWELAGNETDTMIGYHAVSVIADAMVKGISGFDRELAFAAMKHSAELKHFGLGSYIDHGFINLEDERESVSKTLEYAYDDWCIAVVAKLLGHKDDYERYLRRAQSYKNVFDRGTGFMRPRTNGGWLTPFDPREVNSSFTEANSWQYSFFVPQDISGLIELSGGEAKFAHKLDDLFSAEGKTTGLEQLDITGLIGQYAHGNEPSHHIAYLYDYVRQPWKTQYRVRQIMDEFYKPTPDGLIGNEDCGQMSAWYILSAAGFYPVTPGSTIYAIGTPLFPEVKFNLENGKSFVIKANNVSKQNFYIQSAKLNGNVYRKSFLRHEDLMQGGELVFEMGATPNTQWAAEPPVSKITEEPIVVAPVIEAAKKTFVDQLEVSIKAASGVSRLYYSTDELEPNQNSKKYQRPFVVDNTTTIKARAIDSKGEMSQVVKATFRKMPHNWSLTLNSKYSNQYRGGGDDALIDGIRGTTNFTGGAWQGFQGKDLIAVVDFGRTENISKLGAGFLQDVGSWILMPVRVDFEISIDGNNFVQVLEIENNVSSRDYTTVMKDFTGTIQPKTARYVRMHAYNAGKLPAWHPGAGGDSWIFADEILIE